MKWQVVEAKVQLVMVLNFCIPGRTGMQPRQAVWLLSSKNDVRPVGQRAGWRPYTPAVSTCELRNCVQPRNQLSQLLASQRPLPL